MTPMSKHQYDAMTAERVKDDLGPFCGSYEGYLKAVEQENQLRKEQQENQLRKEN